MQEEHADQAYNEAIQHGQYSERIKGLRGKYDHIRVLWEDLITAFYLRPHLETIVKKKESAQEGLRLYDLGCGTGDGYDLLSKLPGRTKLGEHDTRLIPQELLEHYKGVDLNIELLKEGENVFGHYDHVNFCRGDFSNGLPVEEGEPPYDLYFTSYGTLSHSSDEELEKLFMDIARHGRNGSLIMGDWIGRFSYEWQNLWTDNFQERTHIDYKINYLYNDDERDQIEVSSFPLRLMTPQEVSEIVDRAAEKTGIDLEIIRFFDRSLFVGRHIETGTYNGNPQLIRSMVNSLHEPGLRTYFPDLKFNFIPKKGFSWQNRMLKDLADCWNTLLDYTMALMKFSDRGSNAMLPDPPLTEFQALERAFDVMRQTVEVSKGLFGDTRADLIESQLGFALRSLEMNMQRGMGQGHGLVAIIRVSK